MTVAGRGLLVAPAVLALLVMPALLAGAAGCTRSEAGTPRPSSNSPTGSAPTSATDPLPPRTRSVKLDDVDPCTVLTEQQRAALAIDRPPLKTADSSGPLDGAPGCFYRSSPEEYGVRITTSTKVGLADYLAQLRENPTRKVVDVAGFPAVQQEPSASEPETGSGFCMVDVDVADDQMLAVQFGQTAAKPDKRLPIETLCAKAVEVAKAALTTLQAQR
jgi:hypothetical protein